VIPKDCKRLAEVDFPIAVVSKLAVRETYLRQGHPKALHLWWARRPLAACRAMLLGLLLPDPCDPQCPLDFKEQARKLLPKVQGPVGPKDEDLRRALLKFIGDFANWDLSAHPVYLEVSRGLVKAAYPEETPLVVDPFAGGGSIPLEALRLGCETFASDLNPVACLILKVMLEDIPRNGPKLAEELRRIGAEIKKAAEKELAEFYPPDPDGSKPIAYLWARTVKCEAPKCGTQIPLVRSFWLCNKANRKRALKYKVIRPEGVKHTSPSIGFEIFEPKTEREVPAGTVNNGRAVCPVCQTVLPGHRLQAQLTAKRGGANDAMLLVVVTSDQRARRVYRLPTHKDYQCIDRARKVLTELMREKNCLPELQEPLSPIRPSPNARGVSAPTRYGATAFKDLFIDRQRLSIMIFSKLISSTAKSPAVRRLLALALDKVAMKCNAHCRWISTGESLADLFGRHALSMVWDFAESLPTGESMGSWDQIIEQFQHAIREIACSISNPGQVSLEDACQSPIPDQAGDIWFTDPPYYDNIPYADLSDFFYVWLKRTLIDEPLFKNSECLKSQLTPKEREAVWNQAHVINGTPKGPEFFERSIARACREGRRLLSETGLGCMVFAHKTTEGWEALLTGMIESGWLITASWPIATEMPTRVSAKDSASLATSIHLVCRPRPEDATVGDWGEVLRELPKRVGDWMERLQREGIRGADLVFACIGPALEIYSRYSKVVDAEERAIPLGGDPEAKEPHRRGFLAYVWEVVGRLALEQVLGTADLPAEATAQAGATARNGMALSAVKDTAQAGGALEEDARLTALFLWTLQSTNGESPSPQPSPDGRGRKGEGEEEEADEEEEAPKKKKTGYSLIFDVARRFAQPLGIHLPEWEGRIIETEKGVVRLLSVKERAKQLFGEDGSQAVADQLERSRPGAAQLTLFPQKTEGAMPEIKGRGGKRKKKGTGSVSDQPALGLRQAGEALRTRHEATTLDRIHAAMLLQASGRTNALRALLKAEQDRSPDFLRLANALSALYPKTSEEKRLLDAMLLAVPK